MKYVEQRGKQPFDWWGFLNKENKTREEKEEAKMLSSNWVTCGCGNKDDRIKRNSRGTPDDGRMYALGVEFYELIYEKNYELAKITLRKIDSRELELIKEYEENLKTKKNKLL